MVLIEIYDLNEFRYCTLAACNFVKSNKLWQLILFEALNELLFSQELKYIR